MLKIVTKKRHHLLRKSEENIFATAMWHGYCSYFLVSKNCELTEVGLHPSDPLAVKVVAVRSEWHKICSSYSVNSDTAKAFLIVYFRNELLRQCQIVPKPIPTAVYEDNVGVYYRYGGKL